MGEGTGRGYSGYIHVWPERHTGPEGSFWTLSGTGSGQGACRNKGTSGQKGVPKGSKRVQIHRFGPFLWSFLVNSMLNLPLAFLKELLLEGLPRAFP